MGEERGGEWNEESRKWRKEGRRELNKRVGIGEGKWLKEDRGRYVEGGDRQA